MVARALLHHLIVVPTMRACLVGSKCESGALRGHISTSDGIRLTARRTALTIENVKEISWRCILDSVSRKTQIHLMALNTCLLIALVKNLFTIDHFKFIELLLVSTVVLVSSRLFLTNTSAQEAARTTKVGRCHRLARTGAARSPSR